MEHYLKLFIKHHTLQKDTRCLIGISAAPTEQRPWCGLVRFDGALQSWQRNGEEI